MQGIQLGQKIRNADPERQNGIEKKGGKRMNFMFRTAGMNGQRKKKKYRVYPSYIFIFLKLPYFSQMSTFSFGQKPRSGSGSGFVLKKGCGCGVTWRKGGGDRADFEAV